MNGPTRNRSGSRGQTLVEFALVVPVFLLMLFGVIDIGRFVYTDSVLSQAAREGARLAAVEAGHIGWTTADDPGCGSAGGPVCPANLAALKADLQTAVNRMAAGLGTITNIWVSCDAPGAAPTGNWTTETACTAGHWDAPGTGQTGNLISVHVRYTFTTLTPLVSQLIGGSVQRDAFATMVSN